jgi:hypothetical protein
MAVRNHHAGIDRGCASPAIFNRQDFGPCGVTLSTLQPVWMCGAMPKCRIEARK